MAYSADSFVADEQPTTSKWNKLWSNDAAFNDGSGIGDSAIINRHYADASIDPVHHAGRSREVQAGFMGVDAGGGAAQNTSDGPAIAFTGTPAGFARVAMRIPDDYSSGDVSINLYFRSTDTNSNESTNYYLGCHSVGDVYSSWNIASNITSQTASFSTTVSKLTLTNAVPDASADAGDIISLAWRPSSALTGTLYLLAVTAGYTSNS